MLAVEPRVRKCRCGREALCRFLDQASENELLGFIADRRKVLGGEVWVLCQNLLKDLCYLFAHEGWKAAEQEIRNDANAPHVDLFAVPLSLEDFRRDERWGPTRRHGGPLIANDLGKPKVSDSHLKTVLFA